MEMPTAPSHTAKGFFKSLFDTSFSSLILTRVIKVAYVIAIVIISLEAVVFLIAALATKNAVAIVVGIILMPIVWLLTLIWIRILLELVIIIFFIGEDVRRISHATVLGGPGQAASTASPVQPFGGGVRPAETVAYTPSQPLGGGVTPTETVAYATSQTEQPFTAGVTPTETVAYATSQAEPLRQEVSSQRPAESGATQSLAASQEESPKAERPAAGWYPDPEHEGYARFWGGESWTDQRRQLDSFGGG